MDLWEIIKTTYPELTTKDFLTKIILRNDSDGAGDYIEKWEYSKPIPEGLHLGKSA